MSTSRLQSGYVRLHLAVPKPVAERFKKRCVDRAPRGMKKLGVAAVSILNGLSEDVIDELVEWALTCENAPTRAEPDGGARILSEHLIRQAGQSGSGAEDTHYIDRIITPEIMGRGPKKNAS